LVGSLSFFANRVRVHFHGTAETASTTPYTPDV
jgi:hypothetical protein